MSTEDIKKAVPRTDDVAPCDNVDFSSLLLSSAVLSGLTKAGFQRPSPIQLKAIPLGRCGLDLIVQAKSGTGKTCVFSVIALESISVDTNATQVLILAPTREIAVQIWEVINTIGADIPKLRCYTFIGGLPLADDIQKLRKCHIVVGTPGRIKQLIEFRALNIEAVRLFILDEADKLLEESFQDVVNWIFSSLQENKQMLALSATYPEVLAQHLTAYMRNPTFIRLNVQDPALLGIRQYAKTVPFSPMTQKAFEIKAQHLMHLLSSVDFQQCLVFSNYQLRAESLSDLLNSKGWPATFISGSQDQRNRLVAMAKLKAFKCRVLISTDLTARGIDAQNVNLVVNLDIPWEHETYLHRIGRAGRFGTYGAAVTLVSLGKEMAEMKQIEKKCNTTILSLPDPVPADLAKSSGFVNLDRYIVTEQLVTGADSPAEPQETGPRGDHVVDSTPIKSSKSMLGSEEDHVVKESPIDTIVHSDELAVTIDNLDAVSTSSDDSETEKAQEQKAKLSKGPKNFGASHFVEASRTNVVKAGEQDESTGFTSREGTTTSRSSEDKDRHRLSDCRQAERTLDPVVSTFSKRMDSSFKQAERLIQSIDTQGGETVSVLAPRDEDETGVRTDDQPSPRREVEVDLDMPARFILPEFGNLVSGKARYMGYKEAEASLSSFLLSTESSTTPIEEKTGKNTQRETYEVKTEAGSTSFDDAVLDVERLLLCIRRDRYTRNQDNRTGMLSSQIDNLAIEDDHVLRKHPSDVTMVTEQSALTSGSDLGSQQSADGSGSRRPDNSIGELDRGDASAKKGVAIHGHSTFGGGRQSRRGHSGATAKKAWQKSPTSKKGRKPAPTNKELKTEDQIIGEDYLSRLANCLDSPSSSGSYADTETDPSSTDYQSESYSTEGLEASGKPGARRKDDGWWAEYDEGQYVRDPHSYSREQSGRCDKGRNTRYSTDADMGGWGTAPHGYNEQMRQNYHQQSGAPSGWDAYNCGYEGDGSGHSDLNSSLRQLWSQYSFIVSAQQASQAQCYANYYHQLHDTHRQWATYYEAIARHMRDRQRLSDEYRRQREYIHSVSSLYSQNESRL